MITVEQHLGRILAAVGPVPARAVPVTQALGRVLTEDLRARYAVPPFDNSAMDGFAVRSADVAGAGETTPVRLRVVGDVPAGDAAHPVVGPREAARVMTGAPMPPGADGVVPVERTDQPAGPGHRALPATVAVHAPARDHVRRAGEDVQAGDLVLEAGCRLAPHHLAAAVSVGHTTVPVRPRIRLGVLSTGEELVDPGAPLGPGQIPDSNGPLLLTLAERLGAQAIPLGRVGDEPAALRELLAARLGEVDALVTTGGVSAGAFDVVKEVLAPEVAFDQVAMQPGKPQGFGVLHDDGAGASEHRRSVPVFCLPGNPVSVFVSFLVFVQPALRLLAGLVDPAEAAPPLLPGVAATGWPTPRGRRQYLPVVVEGQRGAMQRHAGDEPAALRVRPASAGGSGSHLVASLARAQALAVVEPSDGVGEGDAVGVMMVP